MLENTGHATFIGATEYDKRRIVPLVRMTFYLRYNQNFLTMMNRDYDLDVPGTEQLVDGKNNSQAAA